MFRRKRHEVQLAQPLTPREVAEPVTEALAFPEEPWWSPNNMRAQVEADRQRFYEEIADEADLRTAATIAAIQASMVFDDQGRRVALDSDRMDEVFAKAMRDGQYIVEATFPEDLL